MSSGLYPLTRHFCSDLTVRKNSVERDRHLRWSIKLSGASPAPTVLDGLCNSEKLPQPTTLNHAFTWFGFLSATCALRFKVVALSANSLQINAHAHTHGGGHGDFAQVNTLA